MGPNLTQAEGIITGTATKLFTVAGPVLVFGISASVIYGVIYWITTVVYLQCSTTVDTVGAAICRPRNRGN